MPKLFIFGLGYSAGRIGWEVVATGSKGNLSFDDRDAVVAELAGADAVLSSVPPDKSSGEDPVLATYFEEILHLEVAGL